ncbi:hypothetical protein FXO38_36114 [Capsicum annuum]|nr:hypothetical protein FXO38_36114 [Capsicum annuum]
MAFLNENSLSEDSRILLLAELLHVTDITKERLVERVYVEPNPALAQPSNQLRETRKKDAKSLFLIQSIMDEPSMGNSEARVFGATSLWHLMYGHLNVKGLKLLGQKNMVVGIPKIDGPDFYKRKCKALVEKQSECSLKDLRSDRGDEFTSKEFNEFCENMAEAVATAMYLLNISPIKAVMNRTSYEAWKGRKPRVSHLKVFGCLAYALDTSPSHLKLDVKSEKCVFVGYIPQSKEYKLYNSKSCKVIINRDVRFNESRSWAWNDGVISAPTVSLVPDVSPESPFAEQSTSITFEIIEESSAEPSPLSVRFEIERVSCEIS